MKNEHAHREASLERQLRDLKKKLKNKKHIVPINTASKPQPMIEESILALPRTAQDQYEVEEIESQRQNIPEVRSNVFKRKTDSKRKVVYYS